MGPSAQTTVSVGMVLAGKYRVDKVLGEGGMGVVVSATHLQLDEPVAVKFLHAHLVQDSDLVARFQREAKAARRIRSEHAVKILDVGELENGAPYMVMEYLAGTDLDKYVRSRGPLSIDEAVDYLLQAGEALAEAHVQGMVHRDLKPANLFISRRADETPLVKVLDFGISKVTGKDGTDLGVTKTNAAVLGSPLYMAPEQMRSLREVDARADIWALGIILHELLTGSPPFNATTLTELCATILQDPPKPLRALRPDAPPGLEEAILRCLQKDPAHRYPDVAALAMELHSFASLGGRASAERIFGVYRAAGIPRGSKPPSAIESARTLVDPTGPNLPLAIITPRVGIATTGKVWSSGSVPAPPTTLPPPAKSNTLTAVLIAMVMVLTAIVVAFVVLPKLRGTPVEATHREAAPVPPPVVVAAAAPPVTASAAPAVSSAPVRPPPPPRAKPAAKRADCTVPYTYDSEGKHWKPECVE